MTETQLDPFANAEKVPSLSFKDAPIGTTFEGTVTEGPKLVQARDYDTEKPAFWDDGNPKMTVVIQLEVNGETRSLWAPKPSAMFAAIGAAQKEAGAVIAIGGTLAVKLTGEKPNANPKKAAQKLYAAKYTAPVAASVDAFGSSTVEPPF